MNTHPPLHLPPAGLSTQAVTRPLGYLYEARLTLPDGREIAAVGISELEARFNAALKAVSR
jgi:hypothetical protein